MPIVGTLQDAMANRRGKPISSNPGEPASATVMRSDLMPDPGEPGDPCPNCKLIEQGAHAVIRTHFHVVDQFQVVVAGEGTIGRNPVRPLTVHYAGAFTAYGPIVAADPGLHYMVFRLGVDRGAAYLPEHRASMRDVPRRGVVTRPVAGFAESPPRSRDAAEARAILAAESDGLAATLHWQPPGSVLRGAPPRQGAGQYYYVQSGSAVLNGRTLAQGSAVHVAPEEDPLELTAGSDGMEVLFLQFPRSA